ncbi:hypothetical protein [Aliarcobacter skirrowii]|uniref:Uncharacterized protein n=1 Tax=Aliarcobacter skirrowii TaxID=28200 RepID=A0AAW9D8A4_9BACT|nr:hypothetical protein [Aliarcobacter skirrowii]MCT7445739.1 hypothetical protein [Aliarcobacter skirrowii]MDD3496151.1 hypothetical protein [Aliarcobacter skirrowii]MDX4011865.1 hypothetical protein [Aliarcobacter skirrowii]MDX4025630.1 hypothetical protein [Aliarcobacter skirrowii]MDX4038414.1 hypothetical protein [Aliarcobacter skirrowii]
MFLGKCPYCDDGQIEIRKKEVRGKKVELYACSNASWVTEDGEFFELSSSSKCSFRIWQNALSRYGHYLKHSEIRALLNNEELELKFKTQKRFGQKERKDYFKKVILHPEYGVQILFDE